MYTTVFTQTSPLGRRLRKEAFWAERTLWDGLRNAQLKGRQFKRQHIFKDEEGEIPLVFVADFYCPEEALVICLDGDVYGSSQGSDAVRDNILYKNGLRMLRVRTEEIHQIEMLKRKVEGVFRLGPIAVEN